jgi:hypothetical protein
MYPSQTFFYKLCYVQWVQYANGPTGMHDSLAAILPV